MNMKKILGYGYKLRNESILDAIINCEYSRGLGDLAKSRKQLLKDIKFDRREGYLSKNAKPKIFKVVVEIEDD